MLRLLSASSLSLALVAPGAVLAADAPTTPAAAPAADSGGEMVVIERIVAVVDDQVVLSSEVDGVVEQMLQAQPPPEGIDRPALVRQRREQVLDSLIAERLLDAEVKKLRVDVTDAEVDRVVQGTMQENNLTDETLKMALGRQGMTLAEYKEQLKKQLTKMKIVQLKVKSRVSVSDEDVKTAARQAEKATAQAGFSRVRARHILWLVPPGGDGETQKRKSLAARGRLAAGGEMVPEFERAAFAAPLGVVVGPVRSPFGWHLIRVDEQLAGEAVDPEAAAAGLRQRLYEKEVETQFQQYIEELKRDAFIEKRL